MGEEKERFRGAVTPPTEASGPVVDILEFVNVSSQRDPSRLKSCLDD